MFNSSSSMSSTKDSVRKSRKVRVFKLVVLSFMSVLCPQEDCSTSALSLHQKILLRQEVDPGNCSMSSAEDSFKDVWIMTAAKTRVQHSTAFGNGVILLLKHLKHLVKPPSYWNNSTTGAKTPPPMVPGASSGQNAWHYNGPHLR